MASLNNLVLALLVITITAPGARSQGMVFVDASATPPGNGTAMSPFTSIQDAVCAAVSGDTIVVAGGTYAEQITVVAKSLDFIGTLGATQTIIDAQSAGTTVSVVGPIAGLGVTICGFTITGGEGADAPDFVSPPQMGEPGGISAIDSALYIRQCVVIGNQGGAGTDSNPFSTAGPGAAGGAYWDNGTVTFEDCKILQNRGGRGGVVSGGGLPGIGGPGAFDGAGSLTIRNSEVASNLPGLDGVGPATSQAAIRLNGSVSARDTEFRANNGGAAAFLILGASFTVDFRRCRFLNNVGVGGVGVAGGLLIGVPAMTSAATIEDCVFDQNSSGFVGGLLVFDNIDLDLNRCTFRNNTGPVAGAAIGGDSSTVSNSIFASNSGIGLSVGQGNHVVSNVVVVDNVAMGVGGIFHNDPMGLGSLSLQNSIVRNNGIPQLTLASTASVSHSNVEGGASGQGNFDADPQFVDAATGDYHLSVASPCIDTGLTNSLLKNLDFEGDPRVIGNTVDIGIDEFGLPCFLGNTIPNSGSLPFAALRVSGQTGAVIAVPIGQPFTIDVAQPPNTPVQALSLLWGLIGLPQRGGEFLTPIGDLCFAPQPADLGNIALFTLSDAWCPANPLALVPGSPAPFSISVPNGLPLSVSITIQGVIEDPMSSLGPVSVSNAVVIDIR